MKLHYFGIPRLCFTASDSGDIFSMGSVGQSLPVQTSTDSKSFLDPKAAGLVNLDSLVSKPAGGASGMYL